MTTTRRSRTIIMLALVLGMLRDLERRPRLRPSNTPFARTWARTDQPVAGGAVQPHLDVGAAGADRADD